MTIQPFRPDAMTSLRSSLLVVAVLLLASSLPSCVAPFVPPIEPISSNLLPNPSFELGSGAEPASWDLRVSGVRVPNEAPSWAQAGPARSGSCSVKLTSSSAFGGDDPCGTVVSCESTEFIPVNYREAYRLSLYARSTSDGNPYLTAMISFYDATKESLNNVCGSGAGARVTGSEWQYLEFVFYDVIPPDSAYAIVVLELFNNYQPYSTEPVWIDDVEFVQVELPPPAHADIPAPELRYPTGGRVVSNPITFEWDPVPGAVKYQISIRADWEVGEAGGYLWATINDTTYTADLSYIVAYPEDDRFFWAVRAFDEQDRPSQWSSAHIFYWYDH